MVQQVNPQLVTLFLKEKVDDEGIMVKSASYAYGRDKFKEQKIFKKEGIIGQVWAEGKSSFINIPNKYSKIVSALGETNPNCIFLVPLETKNDIMGVIEIASLNNIEDHKKEFIEKISEYSYRSPIKGVSAHARGNGQPRVNHETRDGGNTSYSGTNGGARQRA